MGNVTIWNGVNAKNLATDYSFSSPTFDGMLVGNQLTHNASTGVISGGVLSINADPTKFDLTAGSGNVINYTTPTNPSIIKVSWNAFTAQTVTGLASQQATYIMINSAGAIVQLSSFPTAAERRQYIFVGRLGHPNLLNLNNATSIPDYAQSVSSQMYDFLDALGPFNISGNVVSTNGANLTVQKSAGSMFFRGFNYGTSSQNPHIVTTASVAPATLVYYLRSGAAQSSGTVVIPGNYDNGTASPVAVGGGANNTTIQRVFLAPNNMVVVQYGQTIYSTLAAAVAAIGTEAFVVNPLVPPVAILIGFIVVNHGATDLTNTATAAILPAARFSVGAGGGVNPVTTLQQTYNSSTQPQIILSSLGGLQVFDNATPIGGDLFNVASNTGATDYLSVTTAGISTSGTAGVTGTLTAGQIIDSGLTATTAVYSNASKQLTSSTTTPTQLGYLDTSTSNIQTQIDRKAPARNYIQDPLFTQGTTAFWSLGTTGTLTNGIPTGTPTFGSGANANLTIASVSSGQLEGTNSLRYQHVTNQTVAGNMMASSAIALDIADQTRVLGVKFAYKASVNPENGNFSGTSSNSFGWAVYDVTNSSWIGTAGQFNIVQSSGVGYCTGTLQIPSNTTSIRFVFYNATATTATTGGGAITMLLDDFFLGPQVTSIGPAMSDMAAYTTTLANFGNGTAVTAWSRHGNMIFIKGALTVGSSLPSGIFGFSLPSGLSADYSTFPKGAINTDAYQYVGTASAYQSAHYSGVIQRSATSATAFTFAGITAGTDWATAAPITWVAGSVIRFEMSVPIVGWSSNTVQSSDTATTVVAARAYRSSNQTGVNPNASGVKLTPNSVSHDLTGSFDLVNSKYVAPVSGLYRVSAAVQVLSTNILNNVYSLYIKKTGVDSGDLDNRTPAASTTLVLSGSTTIQMSAGDYIEFYIYGAGNNSASTLTVVGSPTASHFEIERLSGPAVVQASESVSVRYYTASAQSVTAAGVTYVYGTKHWDSHNAVTTNGTSTWTFTAPLSGKYSVKGVVSLSPAVTYAGKIYAIIKKNGSDYSISGGSHIPVTATVNDFIMIAGFYDTVDLLAGGTITITAFSTAGTFNSFASALGNYIAIDRIGN